MYREIRLLFSTEEDSLMVNIKLTMLFLAPLLTLTLLTTSLGSLPPQITAAA